MPMLAAGLTPTELKADCANCHALCCTIPAFDQGEDFAIDKPALTTCAHLCKNNLCGIHDDLETRGFRGCTLFDCKGAGQYVTRHMMRATAEEMSESYFYMRRLVDMLELFYLAEKLPLPPDAETRRKAMISRLAPQEGWQADTLKQAIESGLIAEAQSLLSGFRSDLPALASAAS